MLGLHFLVVGFCAVLIAALVKTALEPHALPSFFWADVFENAGDLLAVGARICALFCVLLWGRLFLAVLQSRIFLLKVHNRFLRFRLALLHRFDVILERNKKRLNLRRVGSVGNQLGNSFN